MRRRLTHRMLDPVSVDDVTAGSQENGHFFTQAGSQDDSHEAKTATHDLRAGSQDGMSFSQMLEEEVDMLEAHETSADVAEPSESKRPRTEHAGDAGVTMSQFMSTDFDPALIPQQLPATVAEGSILQQLQETRDVINGFAPAQTWSEPFRHIMEGALAVHRLRLLDLSRREEVLFLELMEGRGLHVRAHDSQCFFYSEHGHWSAYNGVIPQGTLARCKTFLMQLEGLYSMFGNNVLRENEGILVAAQELLRQHGGRSEMLLEACEKAAICRVPAPKKQAAWSGRR